MVWEIILIASVISATSAIPGVFLVLRRMSLISDAISHSVLFGIVILFFLVKSIHSPWLVFGAVATGILTVYLSELLLKTRLLKEDASIGLVFPALFSIGVILISKYAADIHIDTDAVLMGEIALAPFERFELSGFDLGPISVWVMGGIGIFNLLILLVFYKEFKISTFDAGLASALGFAPALLHYLLMFTTSITAVGAFDSVGSILVVALMIAPAASAYLLTDKLYLMIVLSIVIGISASIIGVLLAFWIDVSISGSMATVCGLTFLLAYLFAPKHGIVAIAILHYEKKWIFAGYMVCVHLYYHEDTEIESDESDISQLTSHFNWTEKYSNRVIETGLRERLFTKSKTKLSLTNLGRETARELMNRG